MDNNELWDKYCEAIKMEDSMRRQNYNLQERTRQHKIQWDKQSNKVKDIQGAMGALAAGGDLNDIIENMCVDEDFNQRITNA